MFEFFKFITLLCQGKNEGAGRRMGRSAPSFLLVYGNSPVLHGHFAYLCRHSAAALNLSKPAMEQEYARRVESFLPSYMDLPP